MILAVLDDLMFCSKIKTTANHLGVDLRFSRSVDGAIETMRKNPTTLVILDLNNERIGPLAIVTAMKQDPALAAAAKCFHVPLVVFTPADAPKTKLDAIRRDGADLRPDGRDYDDAERMAKAYATQKGAEFISPYNDADVIAGAATVAAEMFEDDPGLDTLVVPIGGGGLISGMATVAKAINPRCDVIVVEVDASNAFQQSVRAGALVEIVPGATLADGLGGNPDPETITFALIQRLVDRIVTVSEAKLAAAIAGLVEEEHLIAEGAGAAATAALLGRRIDVSGRQVGVVVSGGNIDRARLKSLL
jgi:threonine dehydratase